MARNGRGRGAGRKKANGSVDEASTAASAASEPSTSTGASLTSAPSAPLPPPQQRSSIDDDADDDDRRHLSFPKRRPLLEEALALFRLALPLSCDQAGSFAASVVSAAVVARSSLGAPQTAALFLGRSLVSITGLAPVLGSLSAIETFAGAAHGAANADEARRGREEGQGVEVEDDEEGGGLCDGEGAAAAAPPDALGARAALGSVLQRALLAAFALSAAASLLWTARRGALGRFVLVRVLGQDPALSVPAARFAARWPPALFLWAVSEACRRTAVAQGAVRACACVSLAMLLTARPLTKFLVTGRGIVADDDVGLSSSPSSPLSIVGSGLGLGLDGSDAADAGMALLSAAGMALVVLRLDALRPSRAQRAWHGFSREALLSREAWGAHARLAAPAALLVCASWWAGQAAVVIAGRLPDGSEGGGGFSDPKSSQLATTLLSPSLLFSPSVAASLASPSSSSTSSTGASLAAAGVLLNVRAASYMMADGVASAAAVRVANDLGAGDWRRARLAARLAAAAGALLGLAAAAAAVGAREGWARALCPSDNACAGIVVRSAPFLGAAMAAEAAAGAAGGALRGCGRQATAVGVSLAGAWALGLPLQAWLALRPPKAAVALGAGPGVPGLLAGAALASCCLLAALAAVVSRLDWAREARRAALAVEEKEPLDTRTRRHALLSAFSALATAGLSSDRAALAATSTSTSTSPPPLSPPAPPAGWSYARKGKDWPSLGFDSCGLVGKQSPINISPPFTRIRRRRGRRKEEQQGQGQQQQQQPFLELAADYRSAAFDVVVERGVTASPKFTVVAAGGGGGGGGGGGRGQQQEKQRHPAGGVYLLSGGGEEGENGEKKEEIFYPLVQFHFHRPGEESLEGRRGALGLHLVHQRDSEEEEREESSGPLLLLPRFVVVAVAFDLSRGGGGGAPDAALDELFLGGEGDGFNGPPWRRIESFDPTRLLPAGALSPDSPPRRLENFFAFDGSLTTPPCTASARFYFSKSRGAASSGQVSRAVLPRGAQNARPLQERGGRAVWEG